MDDLAVTRDTGRLGTAVFDKLPAGVAVLDAQGRVFAVNEAWRQGDAADHLCDPALPVGADYGALCALTRDRGAEDAGRIASGLVEILADARERLTRVYEFHSAQGRRWSRITILRLRRPVFDGALILHADVTERMFAEERILAKAQYDTLTGLPNANLFRDRLDHACAATNRSGCQVALLYIEAGNSGIAGDSGTSELADRVTMRILDRLREELRDSDTIARLEAERFAVILTHVADGVGTANCAHRLLRALREPIDIDGHEVRLTTSIGIALFPGDADKVDGLIALAKAALSDTQQSGGNDFRFAAAKRNERLHRQLSAEADLRGALERGEFVLHYLPKLSCAAGQIISAEALLRWCHPTRGMVSPAEFVPVLEQTGLIADVGAWVLRAACAQARQWHDAGFPDMGVAVNLSGRELMTAGLVKQVGEAVAAAGIPAEALELELTESLLMANRVAIGETMAQLRSIGVRLSIDNFGTGYSSLSHLKGIPVHSLKIDRSFIQDIVADPSDVSITRAIIQLAHQLRLKVAAEGVETESQLGLLIANGCDVIQGHFFCQASPPDEITAMLRARRGLPPEMLPSAQGGRTLLLVDDEENIVAALRRLLRRSGYRILTAGGAQEGLEVLAREKVDVIVSDQRMPGMSGVDFLRRVKTIHPDTVRIVLSGYTELQSITEAINEGAIYKFLTKPWDEALLLANIDEAFKHKDMIDDNRRLAAQIIASNSELARANVQLEAALVSQRETLERSEISSFAVIRDALELAPVPILGVNAQGRIAFVNTAAQRLLAQQPVAVDDLAEEVLSALLNPDGEHFLAADGARHRLDRHRMGGAFPGATELIVFARVAS